MIDLLEGIATTRAIRRFSSEPIPDADLASIMFSASRAPTGSNRQSFRFLTLRDGEKAREAKVLLGESFREGWVKKQGIDGYGSGSGDTPKARFERSMDHFVNNFESIPVVVLACIRRRHGTLLDGASLYPACQNLLLSARALGYGGVLTAWHTFVESDLRQLLNIPDDHDIGATIPLGKPMGNHGPVRRRPVSELVFEDEWNREAAWAVDPPGTRFTHAGPPTKVLEPKDRPT